MSVKSSTHCMFWHISLWLKRLPCLLSNSNYQFFWHFTYQIYQVQGFHLDSLALICSVRWILLHFWVASVWVMMYINSLILSSEGFICLLLMHWPRKRNKLAYEVLLFHYYLILPYKVKRTCKVWGHNTLHCSVLV